MKSFHTKIIFMFTMVAVVAITGTAFMLTFNQYLDSLNEELHYNYGVVKKVSGIWYKTTYFGFEDKEQSISVYYGSELFDYVMDNVKVGDFCIVIWKYTDVEAETNLGTISVPWLVKLVQNGEEVFP